MDLVGGKRGRKRGFLMAFEVILGTARRTESSGQSNIIR